MKLVATSEEFERQVDRWVDEGILMPWGEKVESGILPLMAVEQQTKGKVRPVLDFRELNEFVECHTGNNVADVCSDVLREWRRMDGEIALADLKSAYLQVRVTKELWQYQLVRYKGETYCITRLGFGLSSSPRIMARFLKYLLAKSDTIQASTKSYVDDIRVKTAQVTAETLLAHLNRFGLVTKPPEQLEGGIALGLKVLKNGRGELAFTRGNEVPSVPGNLTQRGLFSICGKLVGHYPAAGWLRVACSYVKQRAEGGRWDDYVGEEAASMLAEVISSVGREDPVRGQWLVPKGSAGMVWCDASSIATGVLLEIGGDVAEDAAWLRKKDDYGHINIAELEAVVRGVNLALKWRLREIEVVADSATVCGWVRLMLSEEKRIKTKGAAEILVKRRIGVLKDLIEDLQLGLTITLVPSERNKADMLTQVKKSWLSAGKEREENGVCAGAMSLREMHEMHHMGVDRSLYLTRKLDPTVTRQSVQRLVKGCERCQRIDPAPMVHEGG